MLAYVKLHSLLPVCHINSKMGNVYLLMHPEFLVSVYKGKVTGQPPLYHLTNAEFHRGWERENLRILPSRKSFLPQVKNFL